MINHPRYWVVLALVGAGLSGSGCQSNAAPGTDADSSMEVRSEAPGGVGTIPPSVGGSPGQDCPPDSHPEATQDAEEQRMLVLINQHRADQGLSPLRLHPALVHTSRWLSQDMGTRNYMSHTDSLGRDPFERMDALGYAIKSGWQGENIACGNGDAERTYAQWLNSPEHNANMLSPHYTYIGIARAYGSESSYGWYWTTDFGGD